MSALTHNAVRTRELVEFLRGEGHPVGKLLSDAGVRPQQLEGEEPFLPFEKIAEIWEIAADITGDDLIGFRKGQVQDMRLGGLMTYVGMAAPTLGDLIRNLARYRRVFSDAIELDVSELDRDGVLSWHFRVPILTKHRHRPGDRPRAPTHRRFERPLRRQAPPGSAPIFGHVAPPRRCFAAAGLTS